MGNAPGFLDEQGGKSIFKKSSTDVDDQSLVLPEHAYKRTLKSNFDIRSVLSERIGAVNIFNASQTSYVLPLLV